MRFTRRWIGFLVVPLLLIAGDSRAALPTPGQIAPDFALRSAGGKNLRLREHRGQVVLINFWATWCGPCRQELPLLDKIHAKYRRAGFTVFAVNVEEDVKRAQKMAQDLKLSLPVLFDNEQRVSRAYDLAAMPTTLLIDRQGKVRYVHLGYKPGYEEQYERQVRELLQE